MSTEGTSITPAAAISRSVPRGRRPGPIWLLTLLLAGACTPGARTSFSPAAGVLVPGASELSTSEFRASSANFRLIQEGVRDSATGRDGTRELGRSHYETQLTSYSGAPAFLFVHGFTGRGAPFVDSALVLRRGLVPVWEVQRSGERATRFDYSGAHVRRAVVAPDSARRQTEHTYALPVFHFNELDELISAVPLRSGYHAILPLYSEVDDSVEMDTVMVEQQDTRGMWNVRFADRVIIGHYVIDPSTRAIMGHTVERHTGGAHFILVPDSSVARVGGSSAAESIPAVALR